MRSHESASDGLAWTSVTYSFVVSCFISFVSSYSFYNLRYLYFNVLSTANSHLRNYTHTHTRIHTNTSHTHQTHTHIHTPHTIYKDKCTLFLKNIIEKSSKKRLHGFVQEHILFSSSTGTQESNENKRKNQLWKNTSVAEIVVYSWFTWCNQQSTKFQSN